MAEDSRFSIAPPKEAPPVETSTQQQPTTTPSPEPAVAADPAPDPEVDDEWTQRFRTLAKAEAEVEAARREFRAEREAFEKDSERIKKLLELHKTDKYSLLNELDVDFTEWAKRNVNGGKPDPLDEINALRDEIKELREWRTATEEEKKTADKERQEREAKQDFLASVDKILQADPDRYELTLAEDAPADLVFQVLAKHLNETKKLLTPDEAAAMTEELLDKQYDERVPKLAALKKIAAKLGAQQASQPSKQTQSGPASTPRPVTNAMASDPAERVPADLSPEERRKMVMAKLESLGR